VIASTVGIVLATLVACFAASVLAARRTAEHRPELVRTNVDGRLVPAVLGDALVAGTVAGSAAWVLVEVGFSNKVVGWRLPALLLVVSALWAAGRWDDLQGDERARGFSGHLAAARAGRLTGGIVKLVAGGATGLAAGAMVATGWAIVEVGVLVALTANLVNLLDRAPGRAGKIGLLGYSLPFFSGGAFVLFPVLGALVGCLPFDLKARAMLGDAGANPLGGALGLALGISLERPGRLVAIGVLVVLNALSEKYSFSRVIERVPPLRALDRLGRDGRK
jgi:UDP-N-acetylmuramyl pentapeptide phosphotransferase/UDP-N-acetylglucosamine-1-phosphate transferase